MNRHQVNEAQQSTARIRSSDPCYVVVEADLVDVLRGWRAENASTPLMQQLGISYNTWRKVQAGEPVRLSVAERLKAHTQPQLQRRQQRETAAACSRGQVPVD